MMSRLIISHELSHTPDESTENKKWGSPARVATNALFADIEKKIAMDSPIRNTAAFQALEHSLNEFIKNSWYARDSNEKSTLIQVKIMIDEKTQEIIIHVSDDATGIPSSKAGIYDWKKAIQTPSEKKEVFETDKDKSGGQHLGLATTAYALEKNGGSLALSHNPPKGTVVTLKSPMTPCNHIYDEEDGQNIVVQMVADILKKQPTLAQQMLQNTASDTLIAAIKKAQKMLEKDHPTIETSASGSFHVTSATTPSTAALNGSGMWQTPTSTKKRPQGLTPLLPTPTDCALSAFNK